MTARVPEDYSSLSAALAAVPSAGVSTAVVDVSPGECDVHADGEALGFGPRENDLGIGFQDHFRRQRNGLGSIVRIHIVLAVAAVAAVTAIIATADSTPQLLLARFVSQPNPCPHPLPTLILLFLEQ